jgi:hypothetical protein
MKKSYGIAAHCTPTWTNQRLLISRGPSVMRKENSSLTCQHGQLSRERSFVTFNRFVRFRVAGQWS